MFKMTSIILDAFQKMSEHENTSFYRVLIRIYYNEDKNILSIYSVGWMD